MYIPVVGLEIHVQLNTRSKMFSRESANYFNSEPNSHIDPVSFGLPGALPVPNKAAFEKGIRLALALNCRINQNTKFDRKHYFYPDLPKGYQISQYDKPLGFDGFLEFEVGDDSKRIRIQRVHLEEDTGKSIHDESGDTLIDYNKSGVPLAEIVTMPDFESIEEVIAFAKRLRQIVKYANISGGEMQKGQIRYELNLSVKEAATKGLPDYKIEVKNIGSISVLEKVLKYEVKRQTELLTKGEKIKSQTRGIKGMTGETVFQRSKETADDYRYFPEPDIPPINISDEWIQQIKSTMPELPVERKNRYLSWKLETEQAEILVEEPERGNYFDNAVRLTEEKSLAELIPPKDLVKWINTEIAGLLVKSKQTFATCPIKLDDLIFLVKNVNNNQLSRVNAKNVLEALMVSNKAAEEIVKEKGLMDKIQADEVTLFVDQAITENQKVVEDIKKNPNAIKFLVGQVMRLSRGKANPQEIEQLIRDRLNI